MEEEIIGLGKRAPKQSVLLRQLQSLNNESISTTDMNKKYGVSAAILREAENKKWLSFFEEEMYRDPFKHKEFKKTEPFVLNDTQEKALQPIMKAVKQHEKEVFLLKGVTGSGKTEIYLQTIAENIKKWSISLNACTRNCFNTSNGSFF